MGDNRDIKRGLVKSSVIPSGDKKGIIKNGIKKKGINMKLCSVIPSGDKKAFSSAFR
jgi:hypothetical protein